MSKLQSTAMHMTEVGLETWMMCESSHDLICCWSPFLRCWSPFLRVTNLSPLRKPRDVMRYREFTINQSIWTMRNPERDCILLPLSSVNFREEDSTPVEYNIWTTLIWWEISAQTWTYWLYLDHVDDGVIAVIEGYKSGTCCWSRSSSAVISEILICYFGWQ